MLFHIIQIINDVKNEGNNKPTLFMNTIRDGKNFQMYDGEIKQISMNTDMNAGVGDLELVTT